MDALLGAVPRFLEILWLNIMLSGDNAVVIGMAAAGLAPRLRSRAVLFGIIAAAVLRIIFSVFATYLLGLWWIAFIGGAALLYIAWTFLQEILHHGEEPGESEAVAEQKTLAQALWQIVVADVSMSLDNVLAVAAVARNDVVMLVIGLSVSIVLMGLLGGALARLLDRFRLLAYVGVALIAWIGLELMWEGTAAANEALHLGLPIAAPQHPAAH
jgi:YjbE family integral membrane protein